MIPVMAAADGGFLGAPPHVWLGLAAVIAAIVMVNSLGRRRRPSPPSARAIDSVPGERNEEARLRSEASALMLELEELSRRIGAEVETRYRKLERVIADADDRIARLRRLMEPGDAPSRGDGGASNRERADSDSAPVGLTRDVLALAAAGLSNSQIAAQMGMQTAEVDLILATHGRRGPE